MSRIAGIDFGTSTSEIAVLEEGNPLVIPNHLGEYITPSVVGLSKEGDIIVGKEARDQLLLRPGETVIEVKRLMGGGQTISMGKKEYTPQEIASLIIKYLMDCAGKYLNEKIDRAVITVPAYFSDPQRRATVEAGKLAGIKVERIINEPTAAALDYGLERLKECKNILVYDLGGGTLDVTVLELFTGVLDVKASSGNNELGGKDFDRRLMDYLLERFNSRYQTDVSGDKRALLRLKEAAEKAKIALSAAGEYHVVIPFFTEIKGEPAALEETITRTAFEGLIKDLIDSTAGPVQVALADAGLKASEVDLVLLVGGSTRIPYVRKFIEKTMGAPPQSLIDPDLSVVRGAAVQAGILAGGLSAERDIMITDVCPYTLGTAVLDVFGGIPSGDVYDVIIPRNVTIPVVKEKVYGTVADNQTQVMIEVYQGEYKRASHNNFLGQILLKGIPPAPAFQEKIKVSFAYDVNGILQVKGEILSTGKKGDLIIETAGVDMAPEVDPSGWEKAPQSKKYKAIIKKAERLLAKEEGGYFTIDLESLVKKIKTALVQEENPEKLNALKEELHEIIYTLTEEKNA